ncbi:MAG: hypothetical protein WC708_09150 [Lentisphaeria bacterium]
MMIRFISTVFTVAVSCLVLTGCVSSRDTATGYVNVGSPGGAVGKILATFYAGPRIGRQLNEGRTLTFWEGFRCVPYLGIIPGLCHAYKNSVNCQTDYEYAQSENLNSAGRDPTVLAALSMGVQEGLVDSAVAKTEWNRLVSSDFVSFIALRRALSEKYITQVEYDQAVSQLAMNFLANGKSPGGDPLNAGVLHEALTRHCLPDNVAVKNGLKKLILNFEIPDSEVVLVAREYNVVTPEEARVLENACVVQARQRICVGAHKSKQMTDQKFKEQMAILKQCAADLSPRLKDIRDAKKKE